MSSPLLATLLSLQARGLSSCCRGRICLLLQLQILACRHGGFLLFRDSNKHDCSGTRGPDMSVARPRSPDGSSDARISHMKTSDVTNFRDVSSLCPAGAHCRRCIEKHGSAVSLDTCLVFRTCCMRNQLCSQAKLAVKKCNRCKFIKNGASWCRALTWIPASSPDTASSAFIRGTKGRQQDVPWHLLGFLSEFQHERPSGNLQCRACLS